MIVLVLGTPDSGKSVKAEEIACSLAGSAEKIYIATMIPFGESGKKRVEKHRKMREGKGFFTLEKPTDVDSAVEEISDIENKTCLLECMSNLVGNEMHDPSKAEYSDAILCDWILEEVMTLGKSCKHLVIVANSFPLEDEGYDDDTRRFVKLTESVNDLLGIKADEVYELVEGEWKLRANH